MGEGGRRSGVVCFGMRAFMVRLRVGTLFVWSSCGRVCSRVGYVLNVFEGRRGRLFVGFGGRSPLGGYFNRREGIMTNKRVRPYASYFKLKITTEGLTMRDSLAEETL
jgi:hypothetical protein